MSVFIDGNGEPDAPQAFPYSTDREYRVCFEGQVRDGYASMSQAIAASNRLERAGDNPHATFAIQYRWIGGDGVWRDC